MRARRILALALSAGLAVQPVVSSIASVAYAVEVDGSGLIPGLDLDLPPYPGMIGGPIIIGPGAWKPPTSLMDYTITLGKIKVGNIVYKEYEAVPYVIGSDETIKIPITVGGYSASGTKTNKVELCQEGADGKVEVIDSYSILANGTSTSIDFEIKGSQVTHTGKLYLLAHGDYLLYGDKAGTYAQERFDLPINVLERDMSGEASFPTSFDFGSETAKFTFPGGLDFISGTEVYFGRGLIPFNLKVEKDGTKTATINVTDVTLALIDELGGNSPDGLNALDRAKQSYDKLSGGGAGGFGAKPLKPTWKIAAIYRWNKQIPKKQSGSLAFSFGLKGGLTASYLIFTGDLDFTGMLGFRGSYGINNEGDSMAVAGPTGYLNLRLGVGLGRSFIGRIGVYGDAKLDAWYILMPKDYAGWESATLKGEFGAEAVLLGKRVFEWAILKGGPWYIVKTQHPGLVTANAQALLGETGLEEAFAGGGVELREEDLSRAYLERDGAWLGGEQVFAEAAGASGEHALATAAEGETNSGLPAAQVNPRVLQENSYPDAQVRIAETPAGKVMIWLSDDPSRGDANRTRLMWSRYDAATDSWSEPAPVADDGTADFDPNLFVDDNGTAHVAWLDASKPLEDNLSVTQIAERMGVSYASLPSGAAAFGEAERVTEAEAGVVHTSPQLAADSGGATVTWATLEASHLLDLGGTQDVVVATRNASGWSARTVVDGTSGVITSLEAGLVDGQTKVAWTESPSGDLEDATDATLSAVGATDDAPVLLASGNVSCVQFATLNGVGALTWKEASSKGLATQAEGGEQGEEPEGDDALLCVTQVGDEVQTVLDGARLPNSYQLYGDLAEGALISYAALTDGNAKVYGRTLDDEGLGEENVLVEHADNITSWDVAGVAHDPAVAFAAERGVGQADNAATLCVAAPESLRRLQLNNAHIEGDQVPGGEVELVAQVTNEGALPLEGCTMKLMDGEGSVFAVKSSAELMEADESVEVRVPFTLPDDFTYDPKRTITAMACFYGAAGAANSSNLTVPLTGEARLDVEAYDWPYGENEVVGFVLRNFGTQEVSGTAAITGVDASGTEHKLGTCAFGPLGANDTATIFVSPTSERFEADGIEYVMVSLQSEQLDEDEFAGIVTWDGKLPEMTEFEAPAEVREAGWAYEDGTWFVKLEGDGGFEGRKTGWHWDNGWYYLMPDDGSMASGWLDVDGARYWFNTRHDGHFGRMATGWFWVDGQWYLAADSGALRHGWAWDGGSGAWYYLNDTDGMMLRDCATPDGLRVGPDGRWVA